MQWGEQGKPSTGLIQLQGSLGQPHSGEHEASLLQDHFFTDHTKSEVLLEAFW